MRATVLVLAAGLGRRYGGSKQIEPVGPHGETLLDYSIHDALEAGFDRVVLVVNDAIEADMRRFVGERCARRAPTSFVVQRMEDPDVGIPQPPGRTKPWGTGHAVLAARGAIAQPFAVINADDYYGPGAFRALRAFLEGAPGRAPTVHAMVGYGLSQTLSAHGPVSRGICEVAPSGELRGVTERLGIVAAPGGGATCDDGAGGRAVLPGDAVVSLNLWGFTPAVFAPLLELFAEFRAGAAADPGMEFYLPGAIDLMMRDGRATVRVLPTAERWFGVTYREDLAPAAAAIRARIAAGIYPERLWDAQSP